MPRRRRNTAKARRRGRRRRFALWVICVVLLLAPCGDSVRSLSAEVRVTSVQAAPPTTRPLASAPSLDPPQHVPAILSPQELDRCWGAIAATRDALRGGRLSAAMASFESLGPGDLDAELRDARLALERDVETEFTRWAGGVASLLAEGQAPSAAHRLALVCEPIAHRRAVERVNAWARERGWPMLLELPPISLGVPAARPLPEGTQLQVWFEGRWAEASVVSCEADSVTVRLVTPQGVVFPTLDRATVAPRALELAQDQALAALQVRNWSLAALWCAVSLRAGQTLGPELARAIEPWCR